ncbi:carbon-nitrogen hydrolase family protein [Caldiplasma sukawensis]
MDEQLSMKITLAQIKTVSDVKENLSKITEVVENHGKNTDLIIFPEYSMFKPDYSNPKKINDISEEMDGEFISTLKKAAFEKKTGIIINFTERRGKAKKPFNTSVYINEFGMISGTYSKLHLFDSYGYRESSLFEKGMRDPDTFMVRGVKSAMEICYDIRFPELSRRYALQGANIIFVNAAFYSGKGKKETWSTLLRARAMENGVFVVACNQPGEEFVGNSMIISPDGTIMESLGDEEGIINASIDLKLIEEYRKTVPVLKSRRLDVYDVMGL